MSGHSKWSTIKRKKGAADAARGKLFTKIIREISVAARNGGADIETNSRLRAAVQTAKAANMPSANIDRAIKKAAGGDDGVELIEISYEGYAPGGVAIVVECLTDNKNRTGPEVKHLMSKRGGSLGKTGCAVSAFTRRGRLTIPAAGLDEDTVFEAVLEAGAEEMESDEDEFEVLTAPDELDAVRRALEEAGLPLGEVGLTLEPNTTVPIEGNNAEKMLLLIELLEDLDDVQHVYANFDISDDEMNRIAEGS